MPHEVGVGWTVTHFQLNLGLARPGPFLEANPGVLR